MNGWLITFWLDIEEFSFGTNPLRSDENHQRDEAICSHVSNLSHTNMYICDILIFSIQQIKNSASSESNTDQLLLSY